MPTRILVVGGGGREHALAWKLAAEPGVNEVGVVPGSDAIADEPRVRRVAGIDPEDPAAVVAVARERAVELVVIGPEAPLAAGVADALAAAEIAVFGPSAAAARIETSKAFGREVAEGAGVPMATGRSFPTDDRTAARAWAGELAARGMGVVVKADGLAAGKGVFVCETADEAADAIARLHGPIVVEERLDGREASVIVLADGVRAVALPPARDHKRLLDGDRGPNTGGMGAYSPLADLSDPDVDRIVGTIHRPVIAELARRGTPFRGFLYAGLMLTDDGPVLLEFNARLGDPEAQVILPRLASPLGPLLLAGARGTLPAAESTVPTLPGATVGVVLAGGRYPDGPARGDRITGLDVARGAGALVFHAGTRRGSDGSFETDGGRVLTVVGRGRDLAAARDVAEGAATAIEWPGMQRRHDIAASSTAAARPAVGAAS